MTLYVFKMSFGFCAGDGSRLAALVAQSVSISHGGSQDVAGKSLVKLQSYGNDTQNSKFILYLVNIL